MATLQQEQGAATAVEIGFPHDKILHEQTWDDNYEPDNEFVDESMYKYCKQHAHIVDKWCTYLVGDCHPC
jgi:hypothetical protein